MKEIEYKILNISKVLFKKFGFKSVTMDDIARELGMSKKTIYNHFSNKKELVSRSIDLYIEAEGQSICCINDKDVDAVYEMFLIAGHVRQVFKEIGTRTMYDLNKYYKESALKLHQFMTDNIYNSITDNLTKGIKDGLYREDVPIGIIARFYVAKAQIIKDDAIFPRDKFSKDLVVDTLLEYHLRAIVTPKGAKLINKYTETN